MMITRHSFAQGRISQPTFFLLLIALLCFGLTSNSLAQSKDRDAQTATSHSIESASPISASFATSSPIGTTKVSSHLPASLASDLKINKEKTESNAPEPATAEPASREMARFANKKIELLNRIAKLLEEKRKLQAMREAYQSQLNELQDKVNERSQRAGSTTP